MSTVLMSCGRLLQVLADTYQNDLRSILMLKDGSAKRVFVDDDNFLIGI